MMENIFKLHKDMPRQGPGDNEYTKKALDLLNLKDNILALDIGCGPGMQTVELAKNIDGKIIALDFHKPYLDELMENARKEGVCQNIESVKGSMFELNKIFEENKFDLVWSEGAIYIMGFENGIKSIKPLLKDKGYVVLSEITWLKDNIPSELKEFWDAGYPQMKNIKGNIEIIESNGYELVDTFELPENAWWENYYNHLKNRCDMLSKEESDNEELMDFIKETESEMDLYKRYNNYYGYVFYIMKNK